MDAGAGDDQGACHAAMGLNADWYHNDSKAGSETNMLSWMFNRHRGKPDRNATGDVAADRLRKLAEVARSVAPEAMRTDPDSIRGEIGDRRAKSQTKSPEKSNGKSDGKSIPKRRLGPDNWEGINAVALLGEEAAAELGDEPDYDDEDMGYDGDPLAGEARQEIGRRLRRHLPDLSLSRRLAIVEEMVAVMEQMARCYMPQVKSIIERELGCSQYLTRQASQRLIYEVHNSSQVSVLAYVELINDADFLDILRGRAMFVRVQEDPNPGADGDDHSGDGKIVPLRSGASKRRQGTSSELAKYLNGRERLSVKAKRRIAHFVAAAIFDELVEAKRIRAEVARAVRQAVRQRIERTRFENAGAEQPMVEPPGAAMNGSDPSGARHQGETPDAELSADQAILEALTRSEDVMMLQALCHHAQLPEEVVSKILESGSARAIVALAWLSGMEAPSSVVLQMSCGIPESALIQPTQSERYSVPTSELKWYIDFFTSMAPVQHDANTVSPLFEP